MTKNTLKNLSRLNFKNLCKLIAYKLKKKLKVKPSKSETELYVFYGYLVKLNGFIIQETDEFYQINFKGKKSKFIKLRKRPSSDLDVFYQIYVDTEYLPLIKSYNANFINQNDSVLNIIDAGSNIGLTSLFFTDYFNRAKIVAIEPDSQNFKLLDFNLSKRDNFDYIKVKGAVWSSNTKIKVINDFRDKSDWSFRVVESDEVDSIEAYTINYLANSNGFDYIDILKIDVEGSEKQIFNSLISDLNFLKKTRCIAIEIHDEFDCREEIYAVLKEYGFTFFNQGELTIGINTLLKNK